MEKVNSVRRRINKNKKNLIFNVLSVICGVLSIVLGVLIYMKKDENASFLKNNFNVDTNFVDTNTKIDSFLNSIFTFRLTSSKAQSVATNVTYLQMEDKNFFSCEGNQIPALDNGIVYYVHQEEDTSYTVLVEYQNDILVGYYNVSQPLVKVYDQIKKGDYIASYENSFKALFKQNGKLTTYDKLY